MGSLIMHLCVANELKKKYNFSDKFIIGTLMPDLLKIAGKGQTETHYIENVIEEDGVKRLPNILKYEQTNHDNIKDEKILGYMTHLIQDKVWFDKYIGKYAKTDANDISKIKYLEYNLIKSDKEFSKDMYKDYENINMYLVNKYNLDINSLKNTINKISPDIEFKKNINSYFNLNNIDFEKENTFITKKDLDDYVLEAVKKSSAQIDKILDM